MTKSNSNELPISVPLSFLVYASLQARLVLWLEMCYNIANVSLGEEDVYH